MLIIRSHHLCTAFCVLKLTQNWCDVRDDDDSDQDLWLSASSGSVVGWPWGGNCVCG